MQLDKHYINELLFRLLDNDIRDQDLEILQTWLNSDIEAKKFYCNFMRDFSTMSLRAMTIVREDNNLSPGDGLISDVFWRLMSEEEKNAPEIKLHEPTRSSEQTIIRTVPVKPIVRSVNKTALWVAITSVAVLLSMIAYVQLAPPPPYEVATVSDSLDAEWSSDMPLKAGTRISSYRKPIQLTDGTLKLITDDNVQIVLEAPTEFRFLSYSEIALQYGKLFAHVSPRGYGFSVSTPNAKIVDLGTEFGVICHIDGNTEVHMYKGKANLFAGNKSENKISEIITANSARKVNRMDSTIEEISLQKDVVVRAINSKSKSVWRGGNINLADLVGGGNGFGTGQADQGVDPSTGTIIQSLPTVDMHAGDAGYHAVPSNPYIDGVFIPGIDPDETMLSSSGLSTKEIPATSGMLWGYVINGAWHHGFDVPRHPLKLNGIQFDPARNPAIAMHSNVGITFDLSAIRKTLPQVSITSFRTGYGISKTVNEWLASRDFNDVDPSPSVDRIKQNRTSSVEFWVFLDGKLMSREKTHSDSQADTINIPIQDNVRFLTLMITESDDTCMFDWALLAKPELTLDLFDEL